MKYITEILQVLKKKNFFLKFKKYKFYIIKIKFLRFIMKLSNIYIFKEKIKVVKF